MAETTKDTVTPNQRTELLNASRQMAEMLNLTRQDGSNVVLCAVNYELFLDCRDRLDDAIEAVLSGAIDDHRPRG